jgi:hypothetical protein
MRTKMSRIPKTGCNLKINPVMSYLRSRLLAGFHISGCGKVEKDSVFQESVLSICCPVRKKILQFYRLKIYN